MENKDKPAYPELRWIKATDRLPGHMVRHSLKINGLPYGGYYDYSVKRFMCPNIGPAGIPAHEVEWLEEIDNSKKESPTIGE